MKRRLTNLMVLVHGISLTLFASVWTMAELSIREIPRKTIDDRLRWWAKSALNFIKLSYTVHNPNDFRIEKGKSYIFMCNHASLYDIPLSMLTIKASIRMLAKKELINIPIWGRSMLMTDFVSLDRQNRRQALKDLENAKEKMKKGIVLWIAPEGSRSRTGELQPFKRGGFRLAMEMGAMIIPVGIKGTHEILPAKTFDVRTGRHADAYIGKPVDASKYSVRTRKDLIAEVENQIRDMIGQPK
ncbi:MAG: 1-acyl-sn-glycerol-3-phosphate acyltransferase [Proteobacteria bacterium]|nr:1-acyl-sn-glycerol-3-phosphate acyltransferase [Pseudomonadota bacterium]